VINCPVCRTFESGTTEHTEQYDQSSGKYFALKSSPIFSEDGRRVAKCVYLMDDITGQVEAREKEKLLQQELNLTSRLASIGEVAAGITHEINNPLTSVIAFAQILSQKDLPGDIAEAVEVINQGAGRIANIVEKLLTFARRRKPHKEYTDINDVIRSIVEMRAYEMRNNNIELVTSLAPDLPHTMANVGELQQVLMNIIINAEQAISGGKRNRGKICVETVDINDTIRISITDDGPGIAEEHIDRLFDPFFTTKDDAGGTGLGLSISYGIIKEHGGKIIARSPEGCGAVFIIELPVVAGVQAREAFVPVREEPVQVAACNILVVDDEIHICQALEKLLSREGHHVETIRAAEKALQKLRNSKYDLILLDIKMPGIDGIEFYHRMKTITPSLQDRVICITGDIISPKNKEFLENTGIPCITKPFGVDELVGLVKEVIGGKMYHEEATYSYR
jgi:signal transduction histidine kinase